MKKASAFHYFLAIPLLAILFSCKKDKSDSPDDDATKPSYVNFKVNGNQQNFSFATIGYASTASGIRLSVVANAQDDFTKNAINFHVITPAVELNTPYTADRGPIEGTYWDGGGNTFIRNGTFRIIYTKFNDLRVEGSFYFEMSRANNPAAKIILSEGEFSVLRQM